MSGLQPTGPLRPAADVGSVGSSSKAAGGQDYSPCIAWPVCRLQRFLFTSSECPQNGNWQQS